MRPLKFIAAAIVAALPFSAQAVTTVGQLDITGTLNRANTQFTSTGKVDFDPDLGTAEIASGIFAPIVTNLEAALSGGMLTATLFDLFDLNLANPLPQDVFATVSPGVTFSITEITSLDNDASDGTRGLMANGEFDVSGLGGGLLPGTLTLSTQSTGEALVSFSATTIAAIPVPAPVLLLLSAIGGLGFLGWRRQVDLA